MDWLPGRQHQTFARIEELRKFIMEKIQEHQDTLDPSIPRDFIDCFLMRLSQVWQIQIIFIVLAQSEAVYADQTFHWLQLRTCYKLSILPYSNISHTYWLKCEFSQQQIFLHKYWALEIIKKSKLFLFHSFRKSILTQLNSIMKTWCRQCWICTWQELRPPAQPSDLQ